MTDESLTDEPDTLPATAAAVPERDPRDVAEERLAVIRAEVVELRKTRDAATNRMNKLLEEETQLVSQFRGTEEGGHLVNQRAIMAHLQRQNDVRMARAGRHQQRRNTPSRVPEIAEHQRWGMCGRNQFAGKLESRHRFYALRAGEEVSVECALGSRLANELESLV